MTRHEKATEIKWLLDILLIKPLSSLFQPVVVEFAEGL